MIRWVWEKASTVFTHLVVATDDQRIKEAVEGFGGIVLMTSVKHRTGTERCAEALELYRQQHEADITHVVNIQGDEPLLKTEQLESLRACFTDGDTEIATLIQPLVDEDALANPNVVKVTVDKSFRALYFSRAPIPFMRDTPQGNHQHTFYSHIGLYA